MARVEDAEAAGIYSLHHHWLAEVVPSSGSLFIPGAAVWTVAHLSELEAVFGGEAQPGVKYLDRLHGQLAAVSPEAKQLMAEIHAVHFLMIHSSAMSKPTKVKYLDTILSWMPQPPAVPASVLDAMHPGVAHPGQGPIQKINTQIAWLIQFAGLWLVLDDEARASYFADPWAMRDFVMEITTSLSLASQLSMLHLAHPDTFEPIVHPGHKLWIIERFGDGANVDDRDRGLLELRQKLTPLYGVNFSWYTDPLVYQWWKNEKGWPHLLLWARRFREDRRFNEFEVDYKHEVAARVRTARDHLSQGDASWVGALSDAFRKKPNNLTNYRTHEAFLQWVKLDEGAAGAALERLWEDAEDWRLRFSVFSDTIAEHAGLKSKGEQISLGAFLMMGEDVGRFPPIKIGTLRAVWKLARWEKDTADSTAAETYSRALVFFDELKRDSSEWDQPITDRLEAQSAAWMVAQYERNHFEWPGSEWDEFLEWRGDATSDDPTDIKVPPSGEPSTDVDDSFAPSGRDHIADAAHDLCVDRSVLDEIISLFEDKPQVVLYGPPGTGKTFLAKRLARAIVEDDGERVSIVQFHPATSYEDFFEGLRPRVTDAGQVTYERTDGPLVAIAERARRDPRPHVLLIDEINRANLPKVFGELLFLLEYRDEEVHTLYRPVERFGLTENLLIIATMNTADRSIALIDAAMRRRFNFVPFFPHQGLMRALLPRWLERHGGPVAVAQLLDSVNNELQPLVGDHVLVGPSHFMKTDLSDKALEQIWTYNIFPLIEEQLWHDRAETARWKWSEVRKRHFGEAPGALEGPSGHEGDTAAPALKESINDDG